MSFGFRMLAAMAAGSALYMACASVASIGYGANHAAGGARDRVVEIFRGGVTSRGGREFSPSEWQAISADAGSAAVLAAVADAPLQIRLFGREQTVHASFVSPRFFAALGVTPDFIPGSACPAGGAEPFCEGAILDSRYVRERFSGTPPSSIGIDGRELPIRGTASAASIPLAIDTSRPDLWIPLSLETTLEPGARAQSLTDRFLSLAARVPAAVDPASFGRRIDRTLTRLEGNRANARPAVTVLPAPAANLTQLLRVTPRGAAFLIDYVPLLALFAMIVSTGVTGYAMSTAAYRGRDSGEPPRFARLAAICTATALAGAALGYLAALIALKTGAFLAATHRLPVVAHAPSLAIAGTALLAGVLAPIAGAAIGAWTKTRWEWAAPQLSPGRLYLILSLTLVALIALSVSNGIFVSDFWEHSAAIQELAAHPLHPSHPIFHLNRPHQFFSPYALVLAMESRLTGLSSVDCLRVEAVLNIAFLFGCFYLFARRMFPEPAMPFYGILCLLFLWGPDAWIHSGFLHFNSLVQTASYPSTFVSALTFLVWYLVVALKDRAGLLLVLLTLLMPVALISHPFTSVAMFTGVSVLWIQPGYPRRSRAAVVLSIAAAFGAAALWPLFPFYRLATQSARWDADVAWMYSNYAAMTLKIFPALVGIPLLIRRLLRNRTDFPGLTFLALLALYGYGGVTGKYVFGRVLPFALAMPQLAVADWLAEGPFLRQPRILALRRGVVALLLAGGATMFAGFALCLPVWQNSYGEFQFLASYVKPEDTVLTDEESSLKEPSFGGRVVAFTTGHTVAFVPGIDARNADRNFFFDSAASDKDRLRIIRKYGVSYVLINRREIDNWPTVLDSVERLGTIRYWDSGMILVSVAR